MQVEVGADGIVVDAELLAEAFGIAPSMVHPGMKSGDITSLCEKGEGSDAGRWRLTFYHAGRAFRLTIDDTGQVLRRTRFDAPRPGRAT
ncbi:hypothetical protein Dshi_2308 [Dinoroseobacter shibae DFL 12 = DSM 16493]|uniref:PepSY domain-containing protein n=2 Tax=Roseobacteraceae TaxID=2854170 RepID=A8LRL3_DINSH|nr:hypothetical protein Dshi_2308 [Dinoroseobacter shibae DFL 12 = DSM 16493]